LEKVYSKIHEEIRKNPDRVKKERKQLPTVWVDKRKTIVDTGKKDKNGKPVQYLVARSLTLAERKANVAKKIQKSLKAKGKAWERSWFKIYIF